MESFKKNFRNALTYGAGSQNWFNNQMSYLGYDCFTTFFNDLSIAEWAGLDKIRDTFRNIMKEWKDNVRYFTEFVMTLNHKCWFWYETKQFEYDACDNKELSRLYTELYEQADNFAREHFAGEDLDYYFTTTD